MVKRFGTRRKAATPRRSRSRSRARSQSRGRRSRSRTPRSLSRARSRTRSRGRAVSKRRRSTVRSSSRLRGGGGIRRSGSVVNRAKSLIRDITGPRAVGIVGGVELGRLSRAAHRSDWTAYTANLGEYLSGTSIARSASCPGMQRVTRVALEADLRGMPNGVFGTFRIAIGPLNAFCEKKDDAWTFKHKIAAETFKKTPPVERMIANVKSGEVVAWDVPKDTPVSTTDTWVVGIIRQVTLRNQMFDDDTTFLFLRVITEYEKIDV